MFRFLLLLLAPLVQAIPLSLSPSLSSTLSTVNPSLVGVCRYADALLFVSTSPPTITIIQPPYTSPITLLIPTELSRNNSTKSTVRSWCNDEMVVQNGPTSCTVHSNPPSLTCHHSVPKVPPQPTLVPDTLTLDGQSIRADSTWYRCSVTVPKQHIQQAFRADSETVVLRFTDLRIATCFASSKAGPTFEGALGAVDSAAVVAGQTGTLTDATTVLLSTAAQRACATVGGTPNRLLWCVNVQGDRGARAIAVQPVDGVGATAVRVVYSDGGLGLLSLADGDLTLGTAAASCLLPPPPVDADAASPAVFVDGCHDGTNLTGHYFVATVGSSVVHGGIAVPRTPLWSTPTPGRIVATAESLGVEPRLEIMSDKKTVYTKAGNGAVLAVAAMDGDKLTVLVLNKVTGQVIYSVEEEAVAGPVRLAAGGHRVYYSYWDTTTHRTELCALELFETAAMSARFIVPVEVDALAVSRTRFGVTRRALLVGTQSGAVYAVPELSVSPLHGHLTKFLSLSRRSALAHEAHITGGVHMLVSQPAHFESTTYAVAAGPTGVIIAAHAPSGSFDRLANNSALFLATVIAALAAAAAWSANAVKTKALTDAWTAP